MSSKDPHVTTHARTKCKKNHGSRSFPRFFFRSLICIRMSQFEYLSCIVGGLFFRFSDGAFYFAILCLRIYKLIRGANILCSRHSFFRLRNSALFQLQKLDTCKLVTKITCQSEELHDRKHR